MSNLPSDNEKGQEDFQCVDNKWCVIIEPPVGEMIYSLHWK